MFGHRIFTAALLATIATAATPDPKEILRSLAVTQDRIEALNVTVNKFSPTNCANLSNAFQIQKQVNEIENTLTYIAKISNRIKGKFSDDDTLDIATAVANLEPYINQTLNNVVAKKKYFTTAVLGFGDLSRTVEYDLKSLQGLVVTLGTAIGAHASDTYASVAPALTAEVRDLFNASIKAFKSCGKVCLPIITLLPDTNSYGYY